MRLKDGTSTAWWNRRGSADHGRLDGDGMIAGNRWSLASAAVRVWLDRGRVCVPDVCRAGLGVSGARQVGRYLQCAGLEPPPGHESVAQRTQATDESQASGEKAVAPTLWLVRSSDRGTGPGRAEPRRRALVLSRRLMSWGATSKPLLLVRMC